MSGTLVLDPSNFATEVMQSDKPVLVDFWAPWCGPCVQVAPILEEIANEYGESLKVGKVDVNEDINRDLATEYRIMSIPCMVVFNNGKEVKRITGSRPKGMLLKELADFI